MCSLHFQDSFLFVFTFLPIRFVLALIALIVRAPLVALGLIRPFHGRLLFPAEKIDLLKGFIIGICAYVMSHIDTSMMYHLIKSQSVIKLYLFYNMLEVIRNCDTSNVCESVFHRMMISR